MVRDESMKEGEKVPSPRIQRSALLSETKLLYRPFLSPTHMTSRCLVSTHLETSLMVSCSAFVLAERGERDISMQCALCVTQTYVRLLHG
jgi:hypothetical protein